MQNQENHDISAQVETVLWDAPDQDVSEVSIPVFSCEFWPIVSKTLDENGKNRRVCMLTFVW